MSATRLPLISIAACVSVTLTCGCAVGPRFHRPVAPAGAGYSPNPLPEVSTATAIHGGDAQRLIAGRDIPFEWWELFQSPELNSLIKKAFEANPAIPAAQAALRQAIL